MFFYMVLDDLSVFYLSFYKSVRKKITKYKEEKVLHILFFLSIIRLS